MLEWLLNVVKLQLILIYECDAYDVYAVHWGFHPR